jgi:hypothetical protein
LAFSRQITPSRLFHSNATSFAVALFPLRAA